MTRLVLIGCMYLFAVIAVASEVDPLLTATGPEFRKTLDLLAHDPATMARLREVAVVGTSGDNLRRELLRRLVLARADAPEVFESFDELVSLNRPDSPMYPKGWIKDPAMPPLDEQFLRHTLDRWLKQAPAKGEWLRQPPEGTPPDPKRMTNGFWPPIAYGLSAEPARLRKWMKAAFSVWASNENGGELQLECLLWLCERTDYDSDVVRAYSANVFGGLTSPDGDKARFITRRLAMLEAGEKFINADNKLGLKNYLDAAEQFGISAQAPTLRRLAENPLWSAYRDRMLQVADKLEEAGDKPKEK
jgi:hypothetical protein